MIKETLEIPLPLKRTVYLTGRINSEAASTCIKEFERIRSHDDDLKDLYQTIFNSTYTPKPIELFINSPGGTVYDMLAIIATMEGAHHTPVDTYCFGYAMSAAFLIFINGKRRNSTRLSTFMIHPLNSMGIGTVDELQINVDECNRIQKLMNQMVYENTSISWRLLKDKFNKGDWFITSKDARDLNIVDAWLVTDRRKKSIVSLPEKTVK